MDCDRDGGDASQGYDRLPRPLRLQIVRIVAPLLGALVIGGCAYWSEKQGELIFRPTKEAWWGYNGAGSSAAVQELWIPVGTEGHQLNAWWLKAEDPNAPALLYLHGARWNLTGSFTRIERWRKLGFSVLAIDYRGFGKSSDVVPSESLAYEDADAAWEHLARLAPGGKRFIVGHSLGGVVAIELAARHPDAAGLFLEATFTSMRDMIANTTWKIGRASCRERV